MELEGICFNKNKTFAGTFQLLNGETVFGKLFYRKNEQCEFLIYRDNISEEFLNVDEILAILSDEEENVYFVNLFGCRLELSSFSFLPKGNAFCGYFDYALFSKTRHFDSSKENINSKINIFINNWAEFCFPQDPKKHATFEQRMSEHKLKNKMMVSFNQDIMGQMMPKNHIFNSLFINNNLTQENINEIEKQLNTILLPLRSSIYIKNVEKHNWFIRVENIPPILDINLISYYLNSLLMCLTNDFGTKVDKIEVVSEDIIEKTSVPARFDYLYYRNIISKNTNYKNRNNIFNYYSFTEKEWTAILNNLFSKNGILEPFFDIIYQNYYEAKLSEYHLERYIDCVAAIGNNKKYGNTKYEVVMKDFVSNLDKDIQKKLLSIFRESLKNITVKNSKKPIKKGWGLIGKKLCELRAMTTHFNEASKRVNMSKYLALYFVLELVVIDYIFEILGIDIQKRLEYKNFYLKRAFSFVVD
ncbi:hypothetical protein J6E39_07535 [bacterium]|nr:hypothetical protein [bacterium]